MCFVLLKLLDFKRIVIPPNVGNGDIQVGLRDILGPYRLSAKNSVLFLSF